jgi:hypothetical protein
VSRSICSAPWLMRVTTRSSASIWPQCRLSQQRTDGVEHRVSAVRRVSLDSEERKLETPLQITFLTMATEREFSAAAGCREENSSATLIESFVSTDSSISRTRSRDRSERRRAARTLSLQRKQAAFPCRRRQPNSGARAVTTRRRSISARNCRDTTFRS